MILIALALCVILTILATFAFRRLARAKDLRMEFDFRARSIQSKMQQSLRLFDQSFGGLEAIRGLRKCVGETEKLYGDIVPRVERFLYVIQSIIWRIAVLRVNASKGGFFRIHLLRDALEAADDETFEGPNGDRINLREQLCKLTHRMRDVANDWRLLQRAADAQRKSARLHFPHTRLDKLFGQLTDLKIPLHWLSEHPLFGNEDSDRAFYAKLDAAKLSDPVKFLRVLEHEQERERKLEENVNRLALSLLLARKKSRCELPDPKTIALEPSDDPLVALHLAEYEQDRLHRLIQTGEKGLDGVVMQATMVGHLIIDCEECAKASCASPAETDAQMSDMRRDAENALEALSLAERVLEGTEPSVGTARARAQIIDGKAYFYSAGTDMRAAEFHYRERTDMKAGRLAEWSGQKFREAHECFKRVVDVCQRVETDRNACARKAAEMPDAHDAAVHDVTAHLGSPKQIKPFVPVSPDKERPDYAACLRDMDAQQQAWDVETWRARKTAEAVQAGTDDLNTNIKTEE